VLIDPVLKSMMKLYVYCSRHLNQLVDFDLPQDVRLFAGYVFPHSRNESPSLVQAIGFNLLSALELSTYI
jgi:hypothetical protein